MVWNYSTTSTCFLLREYTRSRSLGTPSCLPGLSFELLGALPWPVCLCSWCLSIYSLSSSDCSIYAPVGTQVSSECSSSSLVLCLRAHHTSDGGSLSYCPLTQGHIHSLGQESSSYLGPLGAALWGEVLSHVWRSILSLIQDGVNLVADNGGRQQDHSP